MIIQEINLLTLTHVKQHFSLGKEMKVRAEDTLNNWTVEKRQLFVILRRAVLFL